MYNKFEDSGAFKREKRKILARFDLSKKGSIDREIQQLVDLINSKDNYCTTSSCAGRITLLERKTEKKNQANWLIASHQEVTFDPIKKALRSQYDVWLLQESFILHIFCRTIDAASQFLRIAKKLGLKRTGITGLCPKIMIECFGNEKVEALIIKRGRILLDDSALRVLVRECNSRMRRNREKMDELLREVKPM